MPSAKLSRTQFHSSRLPASALLAGVLGLPLAAFSPFVPTLAAQTISANLSGFVNDPDGAVIPGASVVLTNQDSKDKRVTKADSAGFFSFAAIPAGTYQVEVRTKGFSSFVERDIVLHPADKLTLTNVKLAIGEVSTVITVQAASAEILNQGEKSTLITAEDIKRLPVEGRDVTELIKTLPGFAMTAQGNSADNQGPNQDTVGGQTGNYTANGVTSEGVQIISDGVNITDPGNGGGTTQIINMDNVQEVKVQTSNFGADSAKGPIVINAVGKSGGSDYHGELYVYGRTNQLNTQDWFSKFDGDAKPADRYIYPGANFGGPVRIPGTDFNHNKRWTFFLGAEDYVQRNVYAYGSAGSATIDALVPTCAMRGLIPTGTYTNNCSPLPTGQLPSNPADFSRAALTQYFGVDPTAPFAGTTNSNCSAAAGAPLILYVNICGVPSGPYPFLSGTSPTAASSNSTPVIVNGLLSANQLDPNTYALINGLIPLPTGPTFNRDGSVYNYKAINLNNSDSYQTRVRTDFALSDNAKLYLVYNLTYGTGRNPQQTYYSPQDAFGEINTPGGITSSGYSQTASVNFTQVFTPSLTSEFYVGVSYNTGGNNPGSAKSPLASSIGYNGASIYPTTQYPQLDDYGLDGLPLGIFPDFSHPAGQSNAIFQHKFVPNGGDNITKVIKTHTLKFGAYIERTGINETELDIVSQGQIQNYYDGSNTGPGQITEPGPNGHSLNTQGNYLASFMLGLASAYNQFNFQTNSDLYYWTVDGYATDSWKVNKKLTLDIGGRLGHVGPWQDAHGLGLAVWDPALYKKQTSITYAANYTGVLAAQTVVLVPGLVSPGYKWHANDPTVPNSGAGAVWAFFSPRFGVAYDLYGNGKTFFRGGIGAYRSHDSWNDIQAANATSQGQAQSYVGSGGIGLRDITRLTSGTGLANPIGQNGCGCNNKSFGLEAGDNQQPLTYTYSFTVSQQLNPATLFELSYQGSQSSHLLTQYEQGASGDLENVSTIPLGGLFKPDPLTGVVTSPENISNGSALGDYRPFPFYTQANVIRHILYSNYNGLQASIRRTQGRLLYTANYTWSKNLGILGSYSSGNVIDSTNLRPNYGPLQGDRSNVFNANISYDTGKFNHGARLVRAVLGNYDVSGIVFLQSGPNVQRTLGSNFGLGGNLLTASGQTGYPISNINLIGTPDIVLQPHINFDPRSGIDRGKHQYFNGAAFSLPFYGINGPAQLPYIHGPAYLNIDARISKGIHLGDKKDVQLQLSGFNFLNHPNRSFSSKFPTEQQLNYTGLASNPAGANLSNDFGFAKYKFGRRVTELSVKYNF
jgi:hypothetical protein